MSSNVQLNALSHYAVKVNMCNVWMWLVAGVRYVSIQRAAIGHAHQLPRGFRGIVIGILRDGREYFAGAPKDQHQGRNKKKIFQLIVLFLRMRIVGY